MDSRITKDNLSLELKVGVALLDKPLTLTELSEKMNMDKKLIGRALDMLFDQGQIKDTWTKRDNGHYKEISLCEVSRTFFQLIYNKLYS